MLCWCWSGDPLSRSCVGSMQLALQVLTVRSQTGAVYGEKGLTSSPSQRAGLEAYWCENDPLLAAGNTFGDLSAFEDDLPLAARPPHRTIIEPEEEKVLHSSAFLLKGIVCAFQLLFAVSVGSDSGRSSLWLVVLGLGGSCLNYAGRSCCRLRETGFYFLPPEPASIRRRCARCRWTELCGCQVQRSESSAARTCHVIGQNRSTHRSCLDGTTAQSQNCRAD